MILYANSICDQAALDNETFMFITYVLLSIKF